MSTPAGVLRGRRPLVGPYRRVWNWSWCCAGENLNQLRQRTGSRPERLRQRPPIRPDRSRVHHHRQRPTPHRYPNLGYEPPGNPPRRTRPPRHLPRLGRTSQGSCGSRLRWTVDGTWQMILRGGCPGLTNHAVGARNKGLRRRISRRPRCRGSPPRPIPRWTEHQDPPRRRWPEPAVEAPAHARSSRGQSTAPARRISGDPGQACSRQAIRRPGIRLICAETRRPGPAEPRKDHTADTASFDTGLRKQRNVVERCFNPLRQTRGPPLGGLTIAATILWRR